MGPPRIRRLGGSVAGALCCALVLSMGLGQCGALKFRDWGADEAEAAWESATWQSSSAAQNASVGALDVQLAEFSGIMWRGWGTSLAWFANFVGGLPRPQLQKMLDLLFHPVKGLGLNIVRYVLPGGLNPKLSPLLATLPFQTAPGFRPSPTAVYNWSADAAQRAVLQGALRRGAIAEVTSYSPPWWMTANGDVSGRKGGRQNLEPAKYNAFVSYLADVLAHFKSADNVTFAGLNPFNEPLARWWKGNGNQEGCGFDLESLPVILRLMRQALDQRGLREVALVGIDDWLSRTQAALTRKPQLWQYLSRIALHGYRVPTWITRLGEDQLGRMNWFSKTCWEQKKEVWVTEWGPWKPRPWRSPDLDLALVTARNIFEFVNYAGVSAFVHWQAVVPLMPYNPPPFSPHAGMITMRFNYSAPFNPSLSKQFYIQMQLSRAVPPRSRIIRINAAMRRFVLAAYLPRWNRLTVTVVNQSPHASAVHLRIGAKLKMKSLSPKGIPLQIYRTSHGENFREMYAGTVANSVKDLLGGRRVQSQTLTTFVFSNVTVTS